MTCAFCLLLEYIGMALSYGLSLNAVIFYCVYLTCIMENKMVAVERIKQFINIPSEAAWKTPGCVPPPTWPHRGDIEIKDLKVITFTFFCFSSLALSLDNCTCKIFCSIDIN